MSVIFCYNSTLYKLYRQTRTERLEKTKNGFSKCVLAFIFASIKGLGLFTFEKMVKIIVPYCTVHLQCTVYTLFTFLFPCTVQKFQLRNSHSSHTIFYSDLLKSNS